jgi:hypothetical protein
MELLATHWDRGISRSVACLVSFVCARRCSDVEKIAPRLTKQSIRAQLLSARGCSATSLAKVTVAVFEAPTGRSALSRAEKFWSRRRDVGLGSRVEEGEDQITTI